MDFVWLLIPNDLITDLFPKINHCANNEKIKIFAKTVNHLVVCVETSDLQRLQFLIYSKNHLVIVLMVLSRKQFISDNRVVHPPAAMDKNLNTDLTEDTDLTFSLIFLVGKWLLDFCLDLVDSRVLWHSLSLVKTHPDLTKGQEQVNSGNDFSQSTSAPSRSPP